MWSYNYSGAMAMDQNYLIHSRPVGSKNGYKMFENGKYVGKKLVDPSKVAKVNTNYREQGQPRPNRSNTSAVTSSKKSMTSRTKWDQRVGSSTNRDSGGTKKSPFYVPNTTKYHGESAKEGAAFVRKLGNGKNGNFFEKTMSSIARTFESVIRKAEDFVRKILGLDPKKRNAIDQRRAAGSDGYTTDKWQGRYDSRNSKNENFYSNGWLYSRVGPRKPVGNVEKSYSGSSRTKNKKK